MSSIRARLTAALLLPFALSASAYAAPYGMFWARGKRPAPPDGLTATKLLYYGGPVISNAKVYAVFWGDNVAAETKSKIGPFFVNMLDSTYMDWLKEYNTVGITAVDGRAGTNQAIGRGTYAGSLTIRPSISGALKDPQIQKELEDQIAAGNLPAPDANTLYMIYFPSGVSIEIEGQRSCSTFCAYHYGFKSSRFGSIFYGIMPVCGGFGCGFGNAFDNLTIVSSHEAIEAVTDPFPTPGNSPAYPQAWNTSGGEEIGDVCTSGSSTITGHGIQSKVQWEWSNVLGACNKGPWSQNGLDLVNASRDPAKRAFVMPEAAPYLNAAFAARATSFWNGR